MKITQAMVLAAGLGARLRPITDTTPKPLVRVGGTPMIDHVLDILAESGVCHAVVNVHHLADQMEAHLARYQRMEVSISDERDKLMNSGGGLVKGIHFLEPGPLFVMNADLFWVNELPGRPTNLERLAAFFDPDKMDMVLLCVPLEHTTGHNGKKDFQRNQQDQLSRYNDGDLPLVYAGALALHSRLFEDAPGDAFNLNLYFDKAIERGRLYGIILDGHWLTVGTPEALVEAEGLLSHLAVEV